METRGLSACAPRQDFTDKQKCCPYPNTAHSLWSTTRPMPWSTCETRQPDRLKNSESHGGALATVEGFRLLHSREELPFCGGVGYEH